MGVNANPSLYVVISRLIWAGPLTVLASLVAVLVVRVVAVAMLQPAASFQPLWWPPPIIDTVLLVSAAVFVFSFVATTASNPIRTFRFIAVIVLLFSFLPDVLLAVRHSFGGGWPEASALMLMHVVASAVTVTMLSGLMTVQTEETIEQLARGPVDRRKDA